MVAFAVRRFIHAIFLLWAATVIVFLLLHLVPGDPAQILAGFNSSPEEIEALREALGLDRSLPAQYIDWLGGVLQGDLGESYGSRIPVSELIGQRWVATVQLALAASVITLLFALPTGVWAARKEGKFADTAISAFNSTIISVPSFWLGILALLAFSLHWRVFPAGGRVPFSDGIFEALRALALPALTLGISTGAVLSRYTRSAVRESLLDDHVRTARAKGVTEYRVLRDHGLRNALVPITTVFGLQFGGMLSGTVVIESVFSWPGLGRQVVDALKDRDYAVVQGTLLVLATIVVVVNFVTDVLYGVLDPRIRIEGSKSS